MFSKLKYTETNFRASLTEDRMDSLLHILEQGPELKNYDITNTARLQHNCEDRRPNQKPHCYYRERALSKKIHAIGSLSDLDTSKEEEIKLFSDSDTE